MVASNLVLQQLFPFTTQDRAFSVHLCFKYFLGYYDLMKILVMRKPYSVLGLCLLLLQLFANGKLMISQSKFQLYERVIHPQML